MAVNLDVVLSPIIELIDSVEKKKQYFVLIGTYWLAWTIDGKSYA